MIVPEVSNNPTAFIRCIFDEKILHFAKKFCKLDRQSYKIICRLSERKRSVITIKKYLKAESLEQAYELNQKKNNRIIAGMLWVKMGSNTIQTAIDLSDVVSASVSEHPDAFIIGAMTSLRTLETHKGLHEYTQGAMKESLRHIVGVQFRNMATVGGSIHGRYGFSDVLTMFLAMDSYVELYKEGIIPLEEYANRKRSKDIIINIIVKKEDLRMAYLSQRNTQTDFPTLACAVSFGKKGKRVVIGARPQKAMIIEAEESALEIPESQKDRLADVLSGQVEAQVITGSNMRASAEYRRHLARVLTRRACLQILEGGAEKSC